jgi:hypothetical protein
LTKTNGEAVMTDQMIPPRFGASSKIERHQFWESVIEQQRLSNLTRKQFCLARGISLSDFSRWHYRLGKPLKMNPIKNQQEASPPKNDIPKFIELQTLEDEKKSIEETPVEKATSNFVLKIKTGVELSIPSEFNQEALAKIIHTLEVGR